MKKISSIFIIILLFSNVLISQNKCGTIDTDLDEWITTWDKFGGRPQDNPVYLKARATIYIPMHYHVVREDAGTNGYPLNYLYELHCDLNRHYSNSQIDINFYLDTISYINSTRFFDLTNAEEPSLTSSYNTLNHCNVYLLYSPAGNCGYTYRPRFGNTPSGRGAIFLQASKNNYSCTVPGSTTLAHEMGHWLDLPHTFFGWEGRNYTSNPLNKNQWENVARTGTGSNCKQRGDRFCDTDPDYISNRWTCPNNTIYKDALNVDFTHKPDNYMCYTSDECMSKFTAEQTTQMYAAMSTFNERKDLLVLPIPGLDEIDSFTDFFPKQNTTNDVRINTKNFNFTWSSLPQATGYLVTLAKGSTVYNANFEFSPSTLLIDTLVYDTVLPVLSSLFGANSTNNNFYYWRVRAVNKLSCCGNNVIEKQAFKVGSLDIGFTVENPLCADEASGKIEVDNINSISGLSYTFNSQTVTSSSYFDLEAGNYTIGVVSNGVTYLHNISITSPKPISCSTILNTGGKVTVKAANGKSPYTYSWSNGKSGAAQTSLSSGDYKITITDDNGCKFYDYVVKVTNNTNQILGSSSELSLYPSHVSYGTMIHLDNINSIENGDIRIIDLTGKIIKKITTLSSSPNVEFKWDVKEAGIYFIQLKSEKLTKTFKVIAN